MTEKVECVRAVQNLSANISAICIFVCLAHFIGVKARCKQNEIN
jgi:hypothetical protein